MNMSELSLVVAGVAVVLIVVLGLWFIRMRRQMDYLSAQVTGLQSELAWFRQSISGLTSGAVGVDRRVQQLESSARSLSDRQETYENQQADERPYGHAIRLVQQGAGINRLIQELDLSESEADLIVRLHGHRDTA
jgi:FtsZ-interacting cell division protein ZipA